MFSGSYPNTPGLVTAPVGLPSLLPAFLSLSASPGGPPTHTATAATQQSSSPHLSSELLPWMPVQCKPEKSSFLSSFISPFPHSFRPLSPSWFEPLWWGVMFTLLPHRLRCRPGQASCCSSNSVVLNGDVGRIKLVIFQARSVLGRYAIREC